MASRRRPRRLSSEQDQVPGQAPPPRLSPRPRPVDHAQPGLLQRLRNWWNASQEPEEPEYHPPPPLPPREDDIHGGELHVEVRTARRGEPFRHEIGLMCNINHFGDVQVTGTATGSECSRTRFAPGDIIASASMMVDDDNDTVIYHCSLGAFLPDYRLNALRDFVRKCIYDSDRHDGRASRTRRIRFRVWRLGSAITLANFSKPSTKTVHI